MATAHIEITGSASRLAADVRRAIDALEGLQNTFQDIKAVMDQVALDSDWLALAAKLGVSETEAQAIYNLWGSANTEINGTFLSQLQARAG